MIGPVTNKQILSAIQNTVGSVMGAMAGSALWRVYPTSNYIVSGTQTFPGVAIGIEKFA